jgi:hypothetical protein
MTIATFSSRTTFIFGLLAKITVFENSHNALKNRKIRNQSQRREAEKWAKKADLVGKTP